MIEHAEEFRLRRILVALDAESSTPDSLEAAAEIAGRLRAELIGLFVEDVNLLRSAELPFVRQLSLSAATSEDFDTTTMERELRSLAMQTRRMFEAAARRQKIAHSFRVVRGQVTHEVEAASEEADLVILEGTSRPLSRFVRLGSSARAVARGSTRSVLVLRPGILTARNLIIAYDGSSGADKALGVAARFARAAAGELTILLLSGERAGLEKLEVQAQERLDAFGMTAEFRTFGEPSITGLCGLAQQVGNSTLVMNADSTLIAGDATATEQLLEEISCPLLLVR